MTIEGKIRIVEMARKEGADDSQIERLCAALWPKGAPEISSRTRKVMEDYIKGDNQKAEKKVPVDLEKIISELLHELGMPANILGYKYIRRAVVLCIEDDKMINSLTKKLYPTLAKEFKTTSSRAERAIRHAIEVAWDRGDVEVFQEYFSYSIDNKKCKPTNGEFIAMLTDHIKLQYKL